MQRPQDLLGTIHSMRIHHDREFSIVVFLRSVLRFLLNSGHCVLSSAYSAWTSPGIAQVEVASKGRICMAVNQSFNHIKMFAHSVFHTFSIDLRAPETTARFFRFCESMSFLWVQSCTFVRSRVFVLLSSAKNAVVINARDSWLALRSVRRITGSAFADFEAFQVILSSFWWAWSERQHWVPEQSRLAVRSRSILALSCTALEHVWSFQVRGRQHSFFSISFPADVR